MQSPPPTTESESALIANISSRLLNLPYAELEAGVQTALEDLGTFGGVQRAYIFLLSDDGSCLAEFFEWVRDGVEAHDFEMFRGVPVTAFPWSMEQWRRGETIIVTDPSALPREADPERGACETMSIASYVNMPMFLAGRLIGWLGYDSVDEPMDWSQEQLRLMKVAAGVLTNAIHRKQREELLLNERELTQRLASLATLAAGLAHEINNPLFNVVTAVDLSSELLGELDSTEEAGNEIRGLLDSARQNAYRIRDVVQNLQALSRQTECAPGESDLAAVLDTALGRASNLLRHKGRVVRDYGGPLPVTGTASQLGQVILNLLTNAAQALEAAPGDDPTIVISARTTGRFVETRISDTGPGIPLADQPRIFDPFFTTRDVGVGSGIGLALAHRIVSALGGEIEAHCPDEGGTTMVVRLPAPPEQEDTDGASEHRPRVLIIDDDEEVLDLLARTLRDCTVITASSGREAMDLIGHSQDFDVIVLDVMMPVMSGLDVHRNIREQHPALARRIVFITGGVFSQETEADLDALENPVVYKPISPQELRALVAERMALVSNGGPTRGHHSSTSG